MVANELKTSQTVAGAVAAEVGVKILALNPEALEFDCNAAPNKSSHPTRAGAPLIIVVWFLRG